MLFLSRVKITHNLKSKPQVVQVVQEIYGQIIFPVTIMQGTPGQQSHEFRHQNEAKNSLKFLTVARGSDD